MAYDAQTRKLYGAAHSSDLIALVNDTIPKYFDSRIVYWRNNPPTHWPAGWNNKLSATRTLPRMSVPQSMGAGTPISYASFRASLDQMFKIWSMARNISYTHTENNGWTNGGEALTTHTHCQNVTAFLTENSYSISDRDAQWKLSGRATQGFHVTSLMDKLRRDIEAAPTVSYHLTDECHSNCHNNCHDNCHGSGGFR